MLHLGTLKKAGVKQKRWNIKQCKKAKKGLFSIVFGRTALILMLVLIQLIVLVGVATILNDYAVYVYGGFTVLAAVIVIYIINERGNPAFNMTWVPFDPEFFPAILDAFSIFG